MSELRQYVIEQGERIRLDVFLSAETGETRSYISKLNDSGAVLVNGEKKKSGFSLKAGDIVTLKTAEQVADILPENLPLDIVYQDADVAVINKAQGMSVHPSGAITGGTLVNALMYHIKDLSMIGGVTRPGIVHRLDKNTTGLMVVAKNNNAHLSLSKQFAERTTLKKYVALVEGVIKDDGGNITTLIARSKTDRKKMAVVERDGRLAITDYNVIERYKANTLVEFTLTTGRTHQIRVHAKHILHPIVGDVQYGYLKQRFNTGGQLLHSRELEFTHPSSGKRMKFTAELPEHFKKVLQSVRRESGVNET